MTDDTRYSVSIKFYVDIEQVDQENVWIYAPDFDTALPYLDLLVSKAWATLRQNRISVEAPEQTYETNVKREEDDSNN